MPEDLLEKIIGLEFIEQCPCGALLDEDEKLIEDGLCCACWLKKCRER